MTGIDGVGRWKGKEFFSDTAKQLCRVPCRKIGPSNGSRKGHHQIEPGDPQERRWKPLLQSGLVSPEHKSGNRLFGNRSECHKGSRPPYIQHLLNPHDDPNQINYRQEKTTNWLLPNGHSWWEMIRLTNLFKTHNVIVMRMGLKRIATIGFPMRSICFE